MNIIKHRNNWPWGHSTIIIIEGGKGTVTVSFDKEFEDEATITSLSVHESARKKGLGTKLIKLAEEEVKEFGVNKIVLFADEESFTYDWYQRLGYEPAFDRIYIDSPQIKELAKNI